MRDLKFKIQTRIEKPVTTVFDAIRDPKHLCGYFTHESTGPLEEGKTVRWMWSGEEANDVQVVAVEPNRSITMRWKAFKIDYLTETTFTFEALGPKATMLSITESGWKDDEAGLASSYEHCAGWQHMATCLKAYLEDGTDLRSGTRKKRAEAAG